MALSFNCVCSHLTEILLCGGENPWWRYCGATTRYFLKQIERCEQNFEVKLADGSLRKLLESNG